MLSGVILCITAAAGLGSPLTKYDSANITHQLYFVTLPAGNVILATECPSVQAMSREVTIMIKDELLPCVWGETWKEWNYDC